MKKLYEASAILVLVISITLMSPIPCFANASSQGKVLTVRGDAQVLKAGAKDWEKLAATTILEEGDSVKTGRDGEVRIECMGNAKTAELLVRHNTEFIFTKFRHDAADKIDNTLLMVGIGSVLIKADKLVGASKFEVKTPTSIVGIRGTIFEVHVSIPKDR